MIIKKFQGSSEMEAITKAKDELGKDAVVMNVKTIKPRGLMKLFKSVTVEVTAALEETNAAAAKEETVKEETAKPVSSVTNIASASNTYRPEPDRISEGKVLEEKLESLQALLQKQFASNQENAMKKDILPEETVIAPKVRKDKNSNLQFIKMIYNTLLDNEVEEKNVNKIMEEMDSVMRQDMQIDSVLSNLYQKLILKFGKPECIETNPDKTKVVFFIGPTGVGKTTTVAKLASVFKLEKKKKVAFLTADTYRIAATEQLKTYADIIEAPLSIVYSHEDMAGALESFKDYDLVLIDTAGYSHKNADQQAEIKKLIQSVGEEYDMSVYLVLSATTKYADLKSIVDAYKSVWEYSVIFTKLDETSAYGNLLNVRMYCGANISYTTNGQNVPDDLEVFNSQRIVKLLLGGNS